MKVLDQIKSIDQLGPTEKVNHCRLYGYQCDAMPSWQEIASEAGRLGLATIVVYAIVQGVLEEKTREGRV